MNPRHYDASNRASRSAFLFGDDCAGTGEALAVIEDAGLTCRIVDRVESAHLALQGETADLLVLETVAVSEDNLTDLLARIAPYVRETGIPLIVTASIDQLDLVWGLLAATDTQILCEPSADDRRAAIEVATSRPVSQTLQDSSAARQRELADLRDDLERIARSARSLAAEEAPAEAPEDIARVNAADVRQLIRARRLRDRFFDGRLFADPAWDILLDLYAAHLEHREVSVSSLCIAAATPPTTALRWIASMTDADVLMRRPDKRDKRRYLIELSSSALLAIERYFVALRSMRPV